MADAALAGDPLCAGPSQAGCGNRLGARVEPRQTVHNLVAAYNRHGPKALETPGKGQRQRAYLSLEQEQAIVDQFLKQSELGQVSTGLQVKPALEQAVGHPVAKTTVYRILKRHQWRKVAPRPRHPKSSPREQEAFKKTFPMR